jgi:ribose transport system substrate-binding protein
MGTRLFGGAAVVASCAVLAACGSSGSSSDKTGGGPASAKVDVAAATQVLAPYTKRATAFPVDAPLVKRPPSGTTFAYLQCVTPICGLFSQILQPAAKTLGVKLTITKAGASADQLQNAMNTIIAQKPAAVVLPAVEPDTINTQLAKLNSMSIPVVSNGIMNHQRYGIDAAMFNTQTAQIAGRVLAAWAVKKFGSAANVVFYTTPELSFGPVQKAAFNEEMKKLCASCRVRNVDVAVATIGNSAPSRVVSDLQANPKTNVAVFSTLEAAVGLPAAMRTAGLASKVKVIGFGPNPANLQDLKSGGLTGALGLDLPVMLWTQMDAAARLATKEPLTSLEQRGVPPLQFIETADIKGDPSKGFSAYPDFPQRFAKLWGAAST